MKTPPDGCRGESLFHQLKARFNVSSTFSSVIAESAMTTKPSGVTVMTFPAPFTRSVALT